MKTMLCLFAALGGLAAGVFVLTSAAERNQTPESLAAYEKMKADQEAAAVQAAEIQRNDQAELAALARDVYQVTECRFVQPDLVWVTPPPGADPQSLCQALANVWAARSGLPWVRVESWQDGRRLAQATVRH